MCGIISYFSNEKVYNGNLHKLLHNLLWIDSIRGDHSTGLIYQGGDEVVDTYKRAVPGWDFVQLDRTKQILKDFEKTPYLIGHNRAATKGDVKSTNAHPFTFDHITGVHNGTLHSYHQLTPAGVSHEVDSQHLYHAISLNGFGDTVDRVQGSFNLLWHDATDDSIHLCRNDTRPYTFAKLKGKEILIGASEKTMLKWLVNKFGFEIEYCWNPKPNMEYIWDVGVDMVKPMTVQHEGWKAPVHAPVKYTHNNPQTYDHKTNKIGSVHSQQEKIEFYFDSLAANSHLINGKRNFTMYGETVDGANVSCHCVQDGELELECWYEGMGTWIKFQGANNQTSGYWNVQLNSIKIHPLEDADDPLNICVNCGDDFVESKGMYVDNAPVCLGCCQQLSVKDDQISDEDKKKYQQYMH